MWAWMRDMPIGRKFAMAVCAIAVASTVAGLYFVYQQEQDKLLLLLTARAKVIETQMQLTRTYIAKHYVGKLKNSRVGSEIAIVKDHAENPMAIPLPATAVREIAEEAAKTGLFNARLFSTTPLNPVNVAKDQFEQDAQQAIAAGAETYQRVEPVNGVMTFRRASADKATASACVGCHAGKQVGEVLGVLSIAIPITAAIAASNESVIRTCETLVAVVLMVLMTVYLMLRAVVLRPLSAMAAISKDIAEGDGDLTKRVPVSGRDEIATLGRYFNAFIEKLQQMVGRVAHVTDKVASASVELSATAEEIAKGADGLSARTAQTASAVEEMNATVSQVARHSGQAASIAQQTIQTASDGNTVVRDTVTGMQSISEAVTQSAAIIATLGKSSDQIGEIVCVIEDIADQTNLLALNAAIEAARAGEQGRGFAVVADEVRKLAERTTKATKEIGDMIRQIQQNTKGAVTSMEDGTKKVAGGVELVNKTGAALSKIVEMVNQSADMIRQIAVASEEQSVATHQIASDLEAVAQVTKESSGGAHESAKASRDLSQLAVELQGIVGSFTV